MTARAMLARLVASDANERARGLEALDAPSPDAAYVARRLLVADDHVAVRARAARTLGRAAAPIDVAAWLIDALDDRSPVVRDEVVRALARRRDRSAVAALVATAARDPIWWVRRAAIYALGAIAEDSAPVMAAARGALADPFWRVRHAGVQVLGVLGRRAPGMRDDILAAIAPTSADYLRTLWGPALVEAVAAAPPVSRLPERLRDRDPAVVTARVVAGEPVDPTALVELLCDPHEPLRTAAAARVAAEGDLAAHAAALAWLDEPRIPHVGPAVTAMLDALGDRARTLAEHVLGAPARPGASRWAIGWVVATRHVELYALAHQRAREVADVAMQIDALPLATTDELVDAIRGDALPLATTDVSAVREDALLLATTDELADAIRGDASTAPEAWSSRTAAASVGARLARATAAELLRRPVAQIAEVLDALGIPESPASSGSRGSAVSSIAWIAEDPEVRARLIAAAAVAAPARHRVLARAALSDVHPGPRAVSVATLARAGELSAAERARAACDPDPAVREAALDAAGAIHALRTEPDPFARRAAIALVAGAARRWSAGEVAYPAGSAAGAPRSPIDEAAQLACDDPDPYLRARGALLLRDEAALPTLGRLLGDAHAMVRAAALERLVDLDAQGLDVAAELDAAFALTVAEPPVDAGTAAAGDAGPRDEGVAQLLEGNAVLAVERVDAAPAFERNAASSVAHGGDAALSFEDGDAASPDVDAAPWIEPAARARRALGETGIAIAPLIVSGAFDLAPGSLRLALAGGVDAFFWEPSYAAMTRFLRARGNRDRARVLMGSYHADAASIEADVDSALRRLRRDAIDVCLLFWARSAARLDDAAFTALDRLKRAGKVRAIGFSTHDRDLARAAIAEAPWDVVMTRHSAAHPGIEQALLPEAAARGVGVLGFSALCYGRMVSGPGAPSAADCYRYTLTQPGVTASISAPRRHRELVENLAVLAQPTLDAAAVARLRAHGAGVRAENQRFNALIRQPTRDAAAAALALLEDQLAPAQDREAEACAPPAAMRRSNSSRGRGRASLPSAMLRRGRL